MHHATLVDIQTHGHTSGTEKQLFSVSDGPIFSGNMSWLNVIVLLFCLICFPFNMTKDARHKLTVHFLRPQLSVLFRRQKRDVFIYHM